MTTQAEVEEYVAHAGTLRVGGGTSPLAAARHLIERYLARQTMIDIVVIGANANQQAAKLMCAARMQLKELLAPQEIEVGFVPMRFLTKTVGPTGVIKKDCVVYRLIIIDR